MGIGNELEKLAGKVIVISKDRYSGVITIFYDEEDQRPIGSLSSKIIKIDRDSFTTDSGDVYALSFVSKIVYHSPFKSG